MKREYDFSKARRGAVIREGASKERITIRLDRPILDWFRHHVEAKGSGNYQTLINSVLRDYVENQADRRIPSTLAAGIWKCAKATTGLPWRSMFGVSLAVSRSSRSGRALAARAADAADDRRPGRSIRRADKL